jgi:acyl-CoA synthetase (AMP-forming)/AMP-acid ligase II
MTVAATVAEAARRFGDRVAYVAAEGWALTYGELDRRSDEAAAGLAERGVEEGSVVALVLPSGPDYVVSYAALAKLGAITAGVNPRYTATERAKVVGVAAPDLVVTTGDLMGGLAAVHRALVIEVAAAPDELLAQVRIIGAAPPPLNDDPDRLVAIVFTSGTTGTPKGAIFANAELAAVTRADLGDGVDTWGAGGPMVSGTEFAHVGFMTKLPTYLQLGTTTHLLDRWRAGDVLRLIDQHRMTGVGGVAAQMALLLRHPDIDLYDLSCVRTITMGGAASPPALVREARQRFGAPYSIRYSSTESGGVGIGTAWDADDDEALFSVGRPRAGVDVQVRDDDGKPVPDGAVGELWLRSLTMMRGYWRSPDATAATLVDGWLRTGDLARVDDRGLVRLAGRVKEMYIRGGYNVYPQEVEAALRSHPAVADVAVVPRPDPVMGEIGVAVVIASDPSSPPTLEDLRSFAADDLAAFKLPEALRLVDALPLTAMQKLDRTALAAGEAAHPST